MTAKHPSGSIIDLTYMVAVYIIISYIFIKLISGSIYFRSSLFTKLIYPQIIKYLLNNLIMSIKAIILIFPPHRGQISGPTSYIFCISRAQDLFRPPGVSSSIMWYSGSPSSFLSLPLVTLL